MLYLWLLFIFEIILFLIFFALNKQDIMAPSVIFSLVFSFSTFISILNGKKWNIDYSLEATSIIIIGILLFGLVDIFCRYYLSYKPNINDKKQNIYVICIEKWKSVLIVIVDVIVVLLVYQEVRRIASTNTWYTNIFYAYRAIASHSDNLSADQYMNGLVSQSMKIVIVSGFLFSYFFINNVVICKQKIKKNIIYLLPPFLLCIMTLMTGVRTNILRLVVCILVIWYILLQNKNNWKIKTSWKFIRTLGIALVIVLSVFSISQSLLGRSGNTDFFTVISNYAGASIQHFNQYIQQPPAENMIFGQESLGGIWNILFDLGLTDQVYSAQEEFRYLTSTDFGNVYTIFRRFVQDFGILGMMLCIIILSIIASLLYNRYIRYRKLSYRRLIVIVEYGYFFYIIALASIDNIIPDYLNMGTVLMLILLHAMSWFLFKVKLRICVKKGV